MKKLTTKQETIRTTFLGFFAIFFSVLMTALVGIFAPYSHLGLADFITLQMLSLAIFLMGVLIVLLAFIERKYVKIIKEIRETDYLADERYSAIIEEIREGRNLEENLP